MHIIALDAQHHDHGRAGVGMLGFTDWGQDKASWEMHIEATDCGDYEPGAFYKRELPALNQALLASPVKPDLVVVDAYVFLDEHGRQGLGYKLWEHLGKMVPVVGVAKTKFMDAPQSWEVYRGASKSPLYVTAIGCALQDARKDIVRMHGHFRMPTLLKRVDQLARIALRPVASGADMRI